VLPHCRLLKKRLTVYRPGCVYVWVILIAVSCRKLPSPKSHEGVVKRPLLVPVRWKVTGTPTQALTGAVKFATAVFPLNT
jgi:hypothetical protein